MFIRICHHVQFGSPCQLQTGKDRRVKLQTSHSDSQAEEWPVKAQGETYCKKERCRYNGWQGRRLGLDKVEYNYINAAKLSK